jgi:hypothetical protein
MRVLVFRKLEELPAAVVSSLGVIDGKLLNATKVIVMLK